MNNVQKQLLSQESSIRKTTQQYDKAKTQKSCLENRIPLLQKNLEDLTALVEKQTKDRDRENKRREIAVREKNQMKEQLNKYMEIFNALEIEDAEQFRGKYELLKEDSKALKASTKVIKGNEGQIKSIQKE